MNLGSAPIWARADYNVPEQGVGSDYKQSYPHKPFAFLLGPIANRTLVTGPAVHTSRQQEGLKLPDSQQVPLWNGGYALVFCTCLLLLKGRHSLQNYHAFLIQRLASLCGTSYAPILFHHPLLSPLVALTTA